MSEDREIVAASKAWPVVEAQRVLERVTKRPPAKGFVLFETYPICHWTGTLGPKIREGDKQSPEGFYSITARQSRHRGHTGPGPGTAAARMGAPTRRPRCGSSGRGRGPA